MENERDDQLSGKEGSPSASEDQSRQNMQNQGSEGSFGGQSSGSQSGSADSSSQSGGTGGQPIGGNDSGTGSGRPLSQGADFGTDAPAHGGSAPPRSMGMRGTEFGQMCDHDRSGQQGQSGTGQADLGSQAGSTLSGHTDQQDLGTDQPGRVAGAGEGFILRQDNGSENEEEGDSERDRS